MWVPRMLAVDVDGTLLRNDGTLAPVDRSAIDKAQSHGMLVTLATGRFAPAAIAVARELDLKTPLVCADGAVVMSASGRALAVSAVCERDLAIWRECIGTHNLTSFYFDPSAVFGAQADIERFPWIGGWLADVVATAASPSVSTVVAALGVGTESAVRGACEMFRRRSELKSAEAAVFSVAEPDTWVVRMTPGGCSKALGIGIVATWHGIHAQEVVAVGDWLNDISMLSWAGLSFAMGHSPDEVKAAAKRTLAADATTGGGIAEVLATLGLL